MRVRYKGGSILCMYCSWLLLNAEVSGSVDFRQKFLYINTKYRSPL